MKVLNTIIAVLFFSNATFAQIYTRINYYPANPTVYDTIHIDAITSFVNGDYKFAVSINTHHDTISILTCHYCCGGASGEITLDTTGFNIGPLVSGTWIIKYDVHAIKTLADTFCNIYTDSGSMSRTLTVGVSSIAVIDRDGFSLYPNPVNTKLRCTVSIAEQNAVAQVITPQGSVIQTIFVHDKDFEIDVSSLTSGLYFLLLQDERTHWMKFIKE